MAILQPMFLPTVGIPQTVVASRRPRTMSQREFYSQGINKGINSQAQQLQKFSQQDDRNQQQNSDQQQQFDQAPMTGDYLQAQFQRINDRSAPPVLEPGARVKSAEAELVQPSNFQIYYQQLETLRGAAQDRTAAAAARAMFQQMQSAGNISGGYQGGGGQSFGGAIPSNPAANFRFAQEIGPQFGWSGPELQAWYTLGMKESGWKNTAQNPTSTAYGIGQFLNSTWAGTGIAKTSDPRQQVLAMARYIKNRYGSPSRALAFHLAHNWY